MVAINVCYAKAGVIMLRNNIMPGYRAQNGMAIIVS
jgi:hypothetical protein